MDSHSSKVYLSGRLINFVFFVIAIGNTAFYCQAQNNIIMLNPVKTYQTITGWEASAEAGQTFSLAFTNYKNVLFDLAVNDLGINRVRLTIKSGVENAQDYWSDYRAGRSDRQTWRSVRYSTVNDNNDPFVINWSGFQFSELDHTIDNVILPLKQRVEANGERLFINLNYVAFTKQIGSGLDYHHDDDPKEYAEFVLATYLHLQNKYGWVPRALEVILEPDNTAYWRGKQIGDAIVATAKRLETNGFTPRFIAPSTASMANAISYFDDMIKVPGALSYMSELSYHRYRGVSDTNLQAIASRAAKYGIKTAMLEHIGSGYHDLHKDLKIGRNSAWQQYTLAYPANRDNGGHYYMIDDTDPDNPRIIMGSRTKFLRQYFKYVRNNAMRIEATTNNDSFDPLALINADGKYVVVVKAGTGGSFSIQGLPGGTYGIKYTTASQYNVDLRDVTISAGQTLKTNIPASGVITVYAKISSPISQAPLVNNSPNHTKTLPTPAPSSE